MVAVFNIRSEDDLLRYEEFLDRQREETNDDGECEELRTDFNKLVERFNRLLDERNQIAERHNRLLEENQKLRELAYALGGAKK